MSHGGSSDSEPNLVPLLDLVLQLIMFFMVCANFIVEQVDKTVQLPIAQQAKPMGDGTGDVVILNVDNQGRLNVFNEPPKTRDEEVQVYLERVKADGLRRAAAEAKQNNQQPPSELQTTVIIRAHRDADFKDVYRIMRKCQDIGLRKIQLRAIVRLGA